MKRIPEALEIVLILWLMAGSLFAQQYNESNDFSYALKLYNEHFYDVAAKQFASFINRYPGSERLPDARYYYAESLYHMNEIEDARIEFQSLAVSYPDHPRAAEAWQKVGECYRKLNKLEEAAKAYETIKILYPENALAPRALLDAAACYINVDQFAKAEQVLRDFLDRYPEYSGYSRGHILYGNLLLKKGELERADTQFRKALTIGEDPRVKAEAQLGLAAVFQQLGLRNRAVETLTAVAGAQGGTEVGFRAVERLAQIRLEGREWEAA
ncbi:MAG: tetratricopeptide repeat protein, partial [Calditrichaeota bacterium]